MATNGYDMHHDCSECIRTEAYFTGDSNIVRAKNVDGCVEITGSAVISRFSSPSQIKMKFGSRVQVLLCGGGEKE